MPFPSLEIAPIATTSPLAERETDQPEKSSAASPSISLPRCTQAVPFQAYTLTWPALVPFPELRIAPIAITRPLADRETDPPDSSFGASPLISCPCCVKLSESCWQADVSTQPFLLKTTA